MRTGLRHGELIGLRWIDTDLDAGRLVVRQAVSEGVIGTPKNGRMREVPLCNQALDALRDRPRNDQYVFCAADGSMAWSYKLRCQNPSAGTTGSTVRALAKGIRRNPQLQGACAGPEGKPSTVGKALPSMTSSRHLRVTWRRPDYESRVFSGT
jgi:integrase